MRFKLRYLMGCLICSTAMSAHAAQFTVVDKDNTPVENVVIVVDDGTDALPTAGIQPAKMSQRDRQFDPHIIAVQQHAAVTFPNHDDIAHHVYSFSKTKRFEKKLYKGVSDEPIIFDKAGVVDIGCNVHDWMMAYIYVSDSQYFALTDASGTAHIALPSEGEFNVKVWHPLLPDNELETRTLNLVESGNTITLATVLEDSSDFEIDELGEY